MNGNGKQTKLKHDKFWSEYWKINKPEDELPVRERVGWCAGLFRCAFLAPSEWDTTPLLTDDWELLALRWQPVEGKRKNTQNWNICFGVLLKKKLTRRWITSQRMRWKVRWFILMRIFSTVRIRYRTNFDRWLRAAFFTFAIYWKKVDKHTNSKHAFWENVTKKN